MYIFLHWTFKFLIKEICFVGNDDEWVYDGSCKKQNKKQAVG